MGIATGKRPRFITEEKEGLKNTGKMIPPNASLVKYDNPVLVSRNTDKKTPRAKALKASPTPPAPNGPVPAPPSKSKGSPMDAKAAQQTDEILNLKQNVSKLKRGQMNRS